VPKHPVTSYPGSLTDAEDGAATPMGIATPSLAYYTSLGLTVTGLPTDGTVLLSDGVTAVTNGEILTVAQLTGLMFKPTVAAFGQSSTFTYSVSDPSGNRAAGTAALAIGPDMMPPATTAASLTVAENAGATAIGIPAPTDPNYSASQLTMTVTGLPDRRHGAALRWGNLGHRGRDLTVAQLTGLMFKPTAGAFNQSSCLPTASRTTIVVDGYAPLVPRMRLTLSGRIQTMSGLTTSVSAHQCKPIVRSIATQWYGCAGHPTTPLGLR